jgi:hypothetical protein
VKILQRPHGPFNYTKYPWKKIYQNTAKVKETFIHAQKNKKLKIKLLLQDVETELENTKLRIMSYKNEAIKKRVDFYRRINKKDKEAGQDP